jgi:peptidase M28-like protein
VKSIFVLLLATPIAAAAQSVAAAVGTITPADVSRRVHIIAHDSMGGRDTPSPGLDKTAAYIAREFQRLSLKPGGDSGTYLQHYSILRRQADTIATRLDVGGSKSARLRYGTDFYSVAVMPDRIVSGPAVVVGGGPSAGVDPLGGQSVTGSWVVVMASAGQGRGGLTADYATIEAATAAGAAGVIMVSNRQPGDWQARAGRALRANIAIAGGDSPSGAVLELRDAAAASALGIDPAALRAATSRSIQRLSGVTISFRGAYTVLSRARAPNTVGILEGSDAQLKNEYVVYSAHMDHVGTAGQSAGCRPLGADSICNGADDDASGTVAVVEAAEAFAQLNPRPKRSIIFLTVSGEEHGLWGSEFFAAHPPVPVSAIVANLNLDMVGRNWRDTIVAIGKEHSDLGATLNRVTQAHPELNMKAIDDIWPQERFYFRSDHYNFARVGVPILFFFNGTHPDYHGVGDHPDKIDAEKEARIIKLVFYLGLEVANAAERPKWNPASYKQIVGTN